MNTESTKGVNKNNDNGGEVCTLTIILTLDDHCAPSHAVMTIELFWHSMIIVHIMQWFGAQWYHLDLRVQNEQFSEEKGFILRYTEKEV